MINTPTIETDRLILRRFTPEDIPALLAIQGDGEVNRFVPWFTLKTLEDAKAFYERRFASVYAQERGYQYAICLKEDNVAIGDIHVDMGEAHDLGYGLHRDFWHRGIATEAARAVVEQARRDGIPFVTATHDVNNPRSGGVMRNIGMKYCYTYEERWMPKDIMVHFRMYQLNLDGQDDRVYRGYWEMYEKHFVEEGQR